MDTKNFETLLDKFEKGKCNLSERIFIEELAHEAMESGSEIDQLKEIKSAQEIKEKVWHKIHNSTLEKRTIFLYLNRKRIRFPLIACSIFIIGIILFERPFEIFYKKSTDNIGLETKNNSTRPQSFQLPDGSIVVLEKNSSLVIAADFGKSNRLVTLKGKGFFKVKRNVQKPFLVRVGELVTEVLGTSFKVGAAENTKSIEVAVVTGKVSVYLNRKNNNDSKLNGVVLTPNLKAIYDTENHTLQESIVEAPSIIIPVAGNNLFNYKEVSLRKIKELIKLYYGLEIIFLNSDIENCLFTGDLNGLDLFKQLEFICSSINSTFEIRGSKIFINGRSCR